MAFGDHSRSISMQCPTCGGEAFEYSEGPEVRCVRCDRVTTKDELREANGDRIAAEVDDVKEAILKDVAGELRKAFSKWK